MKEIAVFGGTFDPPTLAHEAIIDACLALADMDEVWIMPSGARLDKPGMSSDEGRMALLGILKNKCFADQPRLKLARFELDLARPTRTVTTVEALERSFPDNHFWFVFGADSVEAMPDWEKGAELAQTLGMLVVPRPGHMMPKATKRVRHLQLNEAGHQGVSSTAVRRALEQKLPIRHMVSPEIADYLLARGALN